MSLSDINNAISVDRAIQECDELGRDEFLRKYGFGKSKVYFLAKNGKYYDSKAIAAVAHKYEHPEKGALKSGEFSGGETTVGELLGRLGFIIERRDEPFPIPGDVLSHEQLMRAFGVGLQGGMRRSKANNLLLLISDPTKSLYDDRWDGDTLHFTGMGKVGDQKLASQNKTLAESRTSGIDLHLCEVFKPTQYTYAGEVEMSGKPYQEIQFDDKNKERLVYMFPLKLKMHGIKPTPKQVDILKIAEGRERYLNGKSLDELKKLASRSQALPQRRMVENDQIIRNQAVVDYVKRAANGICDLCEEPAPFTTKKNKPYLECHHVLPLAEDGNDTIDNAVALCPNCHRRMHSLKKKADTNKLFNRITMRDSEE